tara:strand:+ start:170 stop:631 length:462 start_codon:yes stop_codon:yes gene_type:complete
MVNKITNFVFLILLFLLQSCSGGKIGNFLESSFKNDNFNKSSQNDINKKIKSNIISKDKELVNNKNKNNKIKSNDDTKPLNIVNSVSIKTNDSKKIIKRNQIYKPKSYRVFVILKEVDPSSPTENFSKVLRNGYINFEIEKIELMPEINQNKK